MSNAHALTQRRRRRPLPPGLKIMAALIAVMLLCFGSHVVKIVSGTANGSTVLFLCVEVPWFAWAWPRLVQAWEWWRNG